MSDTRRFYNLLKLDFNLYGKQIFLAPIIINAVFVFITFISLLFATIFIKNNATNSYIFPDFYFILSLIVGIILASSSFKHIHYEEKAISFYLLPISQFEKVFSIFLFYILFYFIVSFIATFIGYLISNTLVFLFTKKPFSITPIFNLIQYKTISIYFLLTSIFMLGSTFFKKLSFFKTILFILVLGFSFSIIYFIFILLIFKNTYVNININLYNLILKSGLSIDTLNLIREIFKITVSLFLYFLTYLRVIEYDVKGE